MLGEQAADKRSDGEADIYCSNIYADDPAPFIWMEKWR